MGKISEFLLATMPAFVIGFFVIVITLLSPEKWIAAIIEVPLIAVSVWYLWQLAVRRRFLEELADS